AAGDGGIAFVDQLAEVTGTTVYASNDPVGNVENADWVWEYFSSSTHEPTSQLDYSQLTGVEVVFRGDWSEENRGFGNDTLEDAFYLGAGGDLNWADLSIHSSTDVDWLKFWLQSTGEVNSYVGINFSHTGGDLDIELYDTDGNYLSGAASASDNEQISLSGRLYGYYYVKVEGFMGAQNDYSFVVSAPYAGYPGDFLEIVPEESFVYPEISNGGYWLSGMNLDSADDYDWYQIKLLDTADTNHYVSVYDFNPNTANIRLGLYDENYQFLSGSDGNQDIETISLNGYSYGTYYVAVDSNGFDSATDY
ncbi:MAG TPA: DUF4347 domain-containing protein, partial [Dehalococcoidia bacterium]|nr:DUF4347 domain-containing protein [Dehalococcoidia bacterium]